MANESTARHAIAAPRPRQRDRLREELTLAQIDHHADAVDELDVQGILAFAERVLPRASDLWVQASLDYKQRLQQQLFFPEGIAYDGIRFNRTALTAPLFNYLAPDQSAEENLVSQTGIEPFARSTRNRSPVGSAPSTIRQPGGDEKAGEVAIAMFSDVLPER